MHQKQHRRLQGATTAQRTGWLGWHLAGAVMCAHLVTAEASPTQEGSATRQMSIQLRLTLLAPAATYTLLILPGDILLATFDGANLTLKYNSRWPQC